MVARKYFRKLIRRLWILRFVLRDTLTRTKPSTSQLPGWADIPVFYINLESREDRDRETRTELDLIGLRNYQRFDAISHQSGVLGCALSHSQLLESLDNVRGPVMICEDDIEFLASQEQLEEILDEFLQDDRLDVLCIAHNNRSKPMPVGRLLAIVHRTKTTSCYVVKEKARGLLLKNFRGSVKGLDRGGSEAKFAPDVFWRRLQLWRLFFAIPRERVARQRASFSDIRGRWVGYGK